MIFYKRFRTIYNNLINYKFPTQSNSCQRGDSLFRNVKETAESKQIKSRNGDRKLGPAKFGLTSQKAPSGGTGPYCKGGWGNIERRVNDGR